MQGTSAIASMDIPSPLEPSIDSNGVPFAAAVTCPTQLLFYNKHSNSTKRDYSSRSSDEPVPKKKRRKTSTHSATTDKITGPIASDQLLQCHDDYDVDRNTNDNNNSSNNTREKQQKKKSKKKKKKNRSSGDESEDRQRVSVACLECKKGHAKCGFERIDGKCARCARLGLPCTVPTVRKKRGPMSKKEREKLKKSSKQTHTTGGVEAQQQQMKKKQKKQQKQLGEINGQQSEAAVAMVLQAVPETEKPSFQIEKKEVDAGEENVGSQLVSQVQSSATSRLQDTLSKQQNFGSRQTPSSEWRQKRHKSSHITAISLNNDNGDNTGDDDTGKVEMEVPVAMGTAAKIQCPATGESCICRPTKSPLPSNRLGSSLNEEQASNPASNVVDIEDIAVGLFGCENCTCMHNINNTCDLIVGQHTLNYGPLYHGGIHGNDPLADVLGSDSSSSSSDGSSNGDDISDDPLDGLESMLSRAEVFHQQKDQEQEKQDKEQQQQQQQQQRNQQHHQQDKQICQKEKQQRQQHCHQQQQELYQQERQYHQHDHRQDRQLYPQLRPQYQHQQHHQFQQQQRYYQQQLLLQQQLQQQRYYQQQHYLKLLEARLPQFHQLQQSHVTEDALAHLLLQQQMPQHYHPQAYQQHYPHMHERQHSNPSHIIHPDVQQQQQHPYLQYG